MLSNQLSLAVLSKAFALFLGGADAEANHCQHQHRRNCCRQSQNYNRVQAGYRSGSYGDGIYAWNYAEQKHYGHGIRGNRYYGSGGQG